MKVDFYTKIILTVIAICLVVIAFRSTPKLLAGNNWTDVNIAAVNGSPVYISPMPVKRAE